MNTIDLSIILGYLAITLFVGLYQGRKVKTMKDYAVADKEITTPVLVATIFATMIGGGSTFGVSERIYSIGIVFFIALFGEPIYKLFMAQYVAPRMSHFPKAISVGDIVAVKFGNIGKIIVGLSSTLKSMGVVGGQIGAMGFLISYFIDIPYEIGVITSTLIVVVYSAYGGIRAVCMTDVIQFAVLIIAMPMVFDLGLQKVGGYEELFTKIPLTHFEFQKDEVIKYSFLFIIFAIPLFDPALIQRLLIAKDVKHMMSSFRIAAFLDLPFLLIIMFIAFIGLILNPNLEANLTLPFVINTALPVGFKGLAIAGMMAVIMSTADSYLHAASLSFVHDVVKPLSQGTLSDKHEFTLAKVTTLVMGIGAIAIALKFNNILAMTISSYNFWIPVAVIPLYAAVFDWNVDYKNFLGGVVMGIAAWLFSAYYLEPAFNIDSLVPSLLGNLIGFFGINLFFPRKKRTTPRKKVTRPSEPSQIMEFFRDKNVQLLVRNFPGGLPTYSRKRVEKHGAPYILFGAFACICYISPYFMWSYDEIHGFLLLSLRGTACILCVILMANAYWPEILKKYLPLYWHCILLYCLIFFPTFMIFQTQGATIWLFNMAIALFFLGVLVDWLSFMVIIAAGIGISYGIFALENPQVIINVDSETLYLVIYLCVFSVLISLLFSRRRERIQDDRVETMKSMGAAIAHEMRTPLANVMMSGRNLEKSTKILDKALKTPSEKNALVLKKELKDLSNLSQRLMRVSKGSQSLINLLLTNLRQDFEAFSQKPLSMKHCLEHTLNEFIFKPGHKSKVHVEGARDFQFKGNLDLVMHVFFNLLKNSLYFIQSSGKGEIFIKLVSGERNNRVIFKDTGSGIEKSRLPHLFKPFYTKRAHGTGVGLSFCKKAIESMGGKITVESELGVHTTFTITFPRIHTQPAEALASKTSTTLLKNKGNEG